MSILNLTQHDATQEQRWAGVVQPSDKTLVRELLTFDDFPTEKKVRQRAYDLAEYAQMEGPRKAMISGPPFMMSILEAKLIALNIQPVYSFSGRVSVDEIQADGSVVKKTVFRHIGFIEVATF